METLSAIKAEMVKKYSGNNEAVRAIKERHFTLKQLFGKQPQKTLDYQVELLCVNGIAPEDAKLLVEAENK